MLCDCPPALAARAAGPSGHLAVYCEASPGWRSVWYRPRCDRRRLARQARRVTEQGFPPTARARGCNNSGAAVVPKDGPAVAAWLRGPPPLVPTLGELFHWARHLLQTCS